MKRIHFLLGVLFFGVANVRINASQKLTQKQRDRLEIATSKKAEHQRELARPPVYKMIDAAIEEKSEYGSDELGKMTSTETFNVNWPTVFNILDSMRGVISVNEYRTFTYNYPLLWLAVKQNNLLVAKILLEKYKANPNILVDLPFFVGEEEPKPMSPLMLAREQGDKAMINLLSKYSTQ